MLSCVLERPASQVPVAVRHLAVAEFEPVQHPKTVEVVIEQVMAGLEFPRAVAHQTSRQPVGEATFGRKALQDDLGIQR